MQESIVFLVRVQCRRKESSRSLSHLLMNFLCKSVKGFLGGSTTKSATSYSFSNDPHNSKGRSKKYRKCTCSNHSLHSADCD